MGNASSDSQFLTPNWRKVKLSIRKKRKWKTLQNLVNEKELNQDLDTFDNRLLVEDTNIPLPLQKIRLKDQSCKCDFQQEPILNVPVVLASSTILHRRNYNKIYLPLGSILRVISKFREWLYVETVHGEDGYIRSETCLPLDKSSPLPTTYSMPSFGIEMSRFVTPDATTNPNLDEAINYAERNVDILYLQATGIRRQIRDSRHQSAGPERGGEDVNDVRLTMRTDYVGNGEYTLSVRRGEVVRLVHARISGWFWIRNENSNEGFIPAAITTYEFDDHDSRK